jgi:hypothetical protein
LNCNRRLEIKGAKPEGLLPFAMFLESESRPHFAHARPISSSSSYIFGFDPHREVDVVTAQGGYEMVFVQARQAVLQSLADKMGRDDGTVNYFVSKVRK